MYLWNAEGSCSGGSGGALECEGQFREELQERHSFMASGMSLFVAWVVRISSEMWEEEKGGEENILRRGSGGSLYHDFPVLTIHGTFTFLIPYLVKGRGLYLNTKGSIII